MTIARREFAVAEIAKIARQEASQLRRPLTFRDVARHFPEEWDEALIIEGCAQAGYSVTQDDPK